jgi:pilus assembly protein FimV
VRPPPRAGHGESFLNSRPFALTLAVALGLASPALSAMGLGPLQVKSGLNRPLVAEIPIISATPAELEALDVRLASPEAFARIGLERPGELTANLQFSVGENSRGQPVILVTTPGRFSEPLLNFLIEADWGKGAVTREYTALIDPPYIAPAVVRPLQAPATAVAAAPVLSAPAAEPEPSVADEPAPAVEPEVATTPDEPSPAVEQAAPAAAEPPAPTLVAPVPVAEPTPSEEVAVAAPEPEPESQATAASEPEPAPAPAEPAPPPAPSMATETRPDQIGPVAAGQTLWSIASQSRPTPAISVNQMMVALLRANPDAFIGDNVNRLRQGSVLRVPGEEEVSRLSAAQAAELVNRQAEAWRTPRAPVPQPAEVSAPAPDIASAPRPSTPAPDRRAARLEIVPPAGDAARGAQSGAAAGAGGTELRAELVQAREDLAAKDAEAAELRSRVAELEKQQSDRQRLIELQDSQVKALQDRLRALEASESAAAATPAVAASPDSAAAATPAAKPWYLNPFALGGAGLLILGGLVLAMRRTRPQAEAEAPSRRLSDDEALRQSMAKTRAASAPILAAPVAAKAPPAVAGDSDLQSRREAVRIRPQDLEAHLNLLRLFHARGNAVDYEKAAQAMRAQVGSPMEPRWREAVVMGASLMPGHPLFSQAGWNTPRYETESKPAKAAAPAPVAAAPAAAAEEVKVFEFPEESTLPEVGEAAASREINLGDEAAVINETFGDTMRDIHRDEAKMLAEDASSATRIELAKAYLDIGDLDGARSMLEEVLIEGGPTAKAEAARILKEMG